MTAVRKYTAGNSEKCKENPHSGMFEDGASMSFSICSLHITWLITEYLSPHDFTPLSVFVFFRIFFALGFRVRRDFSVNPVKLFWVQMYRAKKT